MQFDLLSGDRGEYKTSSMMDKKSAFFGLLLEINETIPLQSSVNSSVLDSKKKIINYFLEMAYLCYNQEMSNVYFQTRFELKKSREGSFCGCPHILNDKNS